MRRGADLERMHKCKGKSGLSRRNLAGQMAAVAFYTINLLRSAENSKKKKKEEKKGKKHRAAQT